MKTIDNKMLYLQKFNDYIMNEEVNQHTDAEYSITEVVKKINNKLGIVFTGKQLIISLTNRFNIDNPISFLKMKKRMEIFIKVEQELIRKNLIKEKVDNIEIDILRIKAKYTFK